MASKALFLLLALLAFVLLLSSEVSARDLAEASKSDTANELENSKYGGYPGGGGGYPGRGGYGDGPGGYPGRGGGGYGGGCRYGCCGHGYYGHGCRCCASAAEASQAATSNKPQN